MSRHWARERWRKQYVREPLQERLWPVMARALHELLNKLAEDDGTLIREAEQPEEALVAALGPQPPELELVRAAVSLLVQQGFLETDGKALWIPELPEAQRFDGRVPAESGSPSDPSSERREAGLSTERVRRHRANKRARMVAELFPDNVSGAQPGGPVSEGVSPGVSGGVSSAVSPPVSPSRGNRRRDPSQILNTEKDTQRDPLPPQRARDTERVSLSVSSLGNVGVSPRGVSSRPRGNEEDEDDSSRSRAEVPESVEAALALPIQERAALIVDRPALGRTLHPERWPEVRRVAEALAEATGLSGGYLGGYEQDDGVRAVVSLYAAGIPPTGLEFVARTVPRQAWWSANGKRLGLSSLTLEVVRRNLPGPDGRSRVTSPGVVKAIALARREAEAANEGS